MAYSYENFVEGKNERQEIKEARERYRRLQILQATMQNRSRARKEEILKQKELLNKKIEECEFLPHWNFKTELSLNEQTLDSDPFEIYNKDMWEIFGEDFGKSVPNLNSNPPNLLDFPLIQCNRF